MESDQMLWDMLKSHIGHQVRIVAYGDTDDPMDICLECEEDKMKAAIYAAQADAYQTAARELIHNME